MLKIIRQKDNNFTILDGADGVEETVSKTFIDKLRSIISIEFDIQENTSSTETPIIEKEIVTESKIDEKQFIFEYIGEDAFNKLKELQDNSKFILKGIEDMIAEKITYKKVGLSLSGLKEVVKVKVNNEIKNLSLDYMRNSKSVILCID